MTDSKCAVVYLLKIVCSWYRCSGHLIMKQS